MPNDENLSRKSPQSISQLRNTDMQESQLRMGSPIMTKENERGTQLSKESLNQISDSLEKLHETKEE